MIMWFLMKIWVKRSNIIDLEKEDMQNTEEIDVEEDINIDKIWYNK